ncbi:MAG: 16S rRNA (uracil(1498)-N(3))-methyltransferase [Alphaproteobacteria bacterium]|jgi:16S rRNA (uracil1498-N3)-methyltransferase|tara:strand:- start:16824 stop:17570 length:747 start_codon:yes stop_codon:yes gene_type:complete
MKSNLIKNIRLYLSDKLLSGHKIFLGKSDSHYLKNVMRIRSGEELLVFNGKEGEWTARVDEITKEGISISILLQVRKQEYYPKIHCYCAPLKFNRYNYTIEKLTELGVSDITPIITEFTDVRTVNTIRIQARIKEAAEQCGLLQLPKIHNEISLSRLLANWKEEHIIIFADEIAENINPYVALKNLREDSISIFIGPEGGFSDKERQRILASNKVLRISLGPRILRADTAAIAAISLIQSAWGDWYSS